MQATGSRATVLGNVQSGSRSKSRPAGHLANALDAAPLARPMSKSREAALGFLVALGSLASTGADGARRASSDASDCASPGHQAMVFAMRPDALRELQAKQ